MESSRSQVPFGSLGERLRQYRENRRESLAEVSGAIEIDPEALERIERGEERPSEDILTLLISHFDLREQEAMQLWESAGFLRGGDMHEALQEFAKRATVVMVALDTRVLYVSGTSVSADHSGVVLSFSQSTAHGQQLPVARVGMSYEQVDQVLQALQQAMLRKTYLPKYPLLPPGSTGLPTE